MEPGDRPATLGREVLELGAAAAKVIRKTTSVAPRALISRGPSAPRRITRHPGAAASWASHLRSRPGRAALRSPFSSRGTARRDRLACRGRHWRAAGRRVSPPVRRRRPGLPPCRRRPSVAHAPSGVKPDRLPSSDERHLVLADDGSDQNLTCIARRGVSGGGAVMVIRPPAPRNRSADQSTYR